jgi:hypothetical protein
VCVISNKGMLPVKHDTGEHQKQIAASCDELKLYV